MAEPDGKITTAQRTLIQTWLKSRHTQPCPVCGNRNFQLVDHLVQPITFAGGGLSIGGVGYPQFMLVCSNCAHTLYFNAVASGILPPGDPPKKE